MLCPAVTTTTAQPSKATRETEIVVWRGSVARVEPLRARPSSGRPAPATKAVFTTVVSE
jgi:hypothetical protein